MYCEPADRGGTINNGTLVARFGDRILTSLKGNYFTAALQWDFVANLGGYLGVLGGVKYFDVDTVMVNADTSTRVAEAEKLLGIYKRFGFQDPQRWITAWDEAKKDTEWVARLTQEALAACP